MQKAVTHIRAVLGRVLVMGLSVQIVLGLAWMCCSFTGLQWFAESTFYVKVSESLICDEYTGILYPLLLMLTGHNYMLLCLLQLAAAFGAGYAFVGAVGVKSSSWRIWGSLVLLTFPMAMQCHMAVLPNSFSFSCFLLLLACVLVAVKKERHCWRWELLGVHVFWLLAALFQPEYLYLGAVPVLVFAIYDVAKYRRSAGRRIWYHFLLAAVFAGMIVSVGNWNTQRGYYGRADGNLTSTVFQRVAWSGLAKYYMDWPAEVREAVTIDNFLEAVKQPENMELLLLPEIEEKLGLDAAKEFYRNISGHVLVDNYREILYEVLWDGLGTLFPTVAVQELLDGRGYSSYCARNYEIMRQECPMLTYVYMQYCIGWFVPGLVLTLCMWLLYGLKKCKIHFFNPILCASSAIFMAVWYVMDSVGTWDYKRGLFVGALWIVWMIVMAVRGVDEEQ